jgi:hypothetical protein
MPSLALRMPVMMSLLPPLRVRSTTIEFGPGKMI